MQLEKIADMRFSNGHKPIMQSGEIKYKERLKGEIMLKTNLDFLIKNEDIEDEKEFYKILEEDRQELIKYLKWRADGWTFKNEIIKNHEEYIEQCKKLLAELEN